MGGRTVEIYMADGSTLGIRQAQIFNRTIKAFSVPRARLAELKEKRWSDTAGAGVYFLFGEGLSEKPKAYIGEAQKVIDRLGAHVREKDFWTTAILFVNKDENINTKYLEARLIDMAKSAGRYELDNGKSQETPALSYANTDAMEEIIPDINLILGVLGHKILEPLQQPQKSTKSVSTPDPILDTELIFKGREFDAKGRVTDDGFLILKGSKSARDVTAAIYPKYDEIRQALVRDGTLIPDADHLTFTRDYLANSSSQAAAIIAGGNRTGPGSWKRASDDKFLGELEQAAAPATTFSPPEEEQQVQASPGTEFSFKGREFEANGRVTEEGHFLILAGSKAAPETVESIYPKYEEIRQHLLGDGVLIERGSNLVFNRDYVANSSSQAASIIAGNNRNGRDSWRRLSDQKFLREIEDDKVSQI